MGTSTYGRTASPPPAPTGTATWQPTARKALPHPRRGRAPIRARGHEVHTSHGLSDFTVDIALWASGSARWQVAVMLDSPEWSGRPTDADLVGGHVQLADRDAAPSLLRSIMGWPQVVRFWLPSWIRDRAALLDQIDAAVAAANEPDMEPDVEERPLPETVDRKIALPEVPAQRCDDVAGGDAQRTIAEPCAAPITSLIQPDPRPAQVSTSLEGGWRASRCVRYGDGSAVRDPGGSGALAPASAAGPSEPQRNARAATGRD